ncbi:MAG: methyltransferase [Desulfomonilaceae bacterium]|nr:methyltransferase [Desulfomonilaceae bacterium]
MAEKWSREKLLEVSGAFMLSRILITAAELDLFSKLETGPRTAENLSEKEGWDLRGLRILMDALAATGFLARSSGGEYGLPHELADMLAADREESVLPMILHRGRMWESWSHLTEIVRTGKNPNPMGADSRSKEEMESFIGAMHVVGKMMADTIAKSVDLTRYTRLLDVGGGPGTYTMAFLNRAPQMSATLFDLPDVAEMARRRLERNGFLHRVDLAEGDFRTDDLPTGYDLVLLSAIVHMNSREGNRALFRKAYQALEPGGTILVRDHFLDESRTHPRDGAVFAVNMLTATRAGNSYMYTEIREDLEACGFVDVRLIREGTKMDQLVSAVKEQAG